MAGAELSSTQRLGVGFVYKTSFDKANRTSLTAKRGAGLEAALPVFALRGARLSRRPHRRPLSGEQRPLKLRRSSTRDTSWRSSADKPIFSSPPPTTGKAVNVKKGQFLAPWDMRNVVAKIVESGIGNVPSRAWAPASATTHRSPTCRAPPIMAETGCPVIFNVTYSVRHHGLAGDCDRRRSAFSAPVLARAAVAAGVAGSIHRRRTTKPTGAVRRPDDDADR